MCTCVCVWGEVGGLCAYMHVFVCLVCVTLCSLSLSVSAPKKQGSKKIESSVRSACGRSGGGSSRQPGVYVCVCLCVYWSWYGMCYPFLFPLSICSQEAGQQCAGSGW